MSPEILTLLAGLLGAVIGAAASIGTVVVQSKIQDRRERTRQAVDLALEDYKIQLELSKRVPGSKRIPPVTLFIDFHLRLARELEAGPLTPEAYKRVALQNQQIFDMLDSLSTEPDPDEGQG